MIRRTGARRDVSEQLRGCVIGFGIPTSRDTFDIALHTKRGSIAASSGWAKYNAQLVSLLAELQPRYERWGVKVIHELGLADLGRLFGNGSYSTVILFTHWSEDGVEFSDRIASVDETAAQIPRDFAGVIDLCVCHPLGLVAELQARCPKAAVKFVDRQVAAGVWLQVYFLVFKAMSTLQLSYVQALERVLLILLQNNTQEGLFKCVP
jgi:hypothetical protein